MFINSNSSKLSRARKLNEGDLVKVRIIEPEIKTVEVEA